MADFQFQDTKPTIDTGTLLEDLRAVAVHLSGKSVTQDGYRLHGKFSSTVMKKRFGSWNRALRAQVYNSIPARTLPMLNCSTTWKQHG